MAHNKQFGLIKPTIAKGNLAKKPSIFEEDTDSEGEGVRPTGLKRPLKRQDKINQSRAIDEDPTVYQYDEIYDEMDQKRKESKLSRKDLDKKPKYISRLLAAAEKRKRENERRIERQVQKEREAEGSEFKDKESFVTSAYKKKLEEMRELDEQDRREQYLEAIGDVKKQGNLDGFYRHLYDQKVNYEDELQKIEAKTGPDQLSDEKIEIHIEKVKKNNKNRKYRKRDDSEYDEEDKDETKIEHLASNIDADSDFSIDSTDEEDKNEKKLPIKIKTKINDKQQIENKNNIQEQKDEIKQDETVEKPVVKKPKIDIWKKRTIGEVFDAAVQRYFERKALREQGN